MKPMMTTMKRVRVDAVTMAASVAVDSVGDFAVMAAGMGVVAVGEAVVVVVVPVVLVVRVLPSTKLRQRPHSLWPICRSVSMMPVSRRFLRASTALHTS